MKYFEVKLKPGGTLYLPFGSFYLLERETSSGEKKYLVGVNVGYALDINEMDYDDWCDLREEVTGKYRYDI